MAKYLLLKHYRGPKTTDVPPMDQWKPEGVEAHIAHAAHRRPVRGDQATLDAEAATRAGSTAERDHLTRQAARLRHTPVPPGPLGR